MERERIHDRLKQMRALLQDGRERIAALRPAWGAHLAGETLRRLSEVIDELQEEIEGSNSMSSVQIEHPAAGKQRGSNR